ncbi:DUF5615 family PIN-like protein [Candidatus Bipolaricaulota bacterium]|nr:DUF5615 family PIN-like protein [Candidatus Bipolaricaulota bacterium]
MALKPYEIGERALVPVLLGIEAFLRGLGWTTKDIRELGKSSASDDEIYKLATVEGWILVTYDLDFSRRFMADKGLPGLVLLRVHPQTAPLGVRSCFLRGLAVSKSGVPLVSMQETRPDPKLSKTPGLPVFVQPYLYLSSAVLCVFARGTSSFSRPFVITHSSRKDR